MKSHTLSRFGLALLLLLITACAVNPVTGTKQFVLMSEAQEIAMGKEADPQVLAYFGLYDDAGLQAFIAEKGREMAAISHRPSLSYEFRIVDSPVVNAFAVPGGYVYFTRGIMAHFNNEAEFAGVLGHEIGHITARHSVIQQRNAMLGQLGIIAGVILVPELGEFIEPLSAGVQLALMSFSRDDERQSDKLGVEYSSRIGYDASEMAGFFNTLEQQRVMAGASEVPEFLSTHPSPAERSVTVAQLAAEWKSKLNLTDARVNRESYLRRLEGLVYGDDPRQGFVENSIFYHPVLKFRFPVPAGWQVQNTPQQVQMAPGNGEALMSLNLARGSSPEEAGNVILQQYGLELVESKRENINGLPALLAVADQRHEEGTIRVLMALIRYGEYIYNMMGIAELSRFPAHQATFLGSMRNFGELREADKLNRKPDVVRVREVPGPMTLLAALQHFRMPQERHAELAVLNGMPLSGLLEKGSLIKVVGK